MSGAGSINGWRCDSCGQITYCVHVHDGVTPFYLACRAEGVEPDQAACKGMGTSLMYPQAPPPPHVIGAVLWEWYSPDPIELIGLEPAMREHVDKGGLCLRRLTDAGRAVLVRGAA